MSTEVGESVRVAAIFNVGDRGEGEGGNGPPQAGLKPVKFNWRSRVYSIKEVTYTWTTRVGKATLLHFSVVDGAGTLFELAYNQATLRWSLEKVE